MKKHEIYTKEFTQAIKRRLTTVLARYIAVTALYATLCVLFCLLAAFDLLNVYVGCALNVVLTVAFLWFSYLFFTVYFKKAKEKSTFVKCLENAYPSVYQGVCSHCEQDGQYVSVYFEDGNVLKLDADAANCFVGGVTYRVDAVNDTIISYCEVGDE